MSPEFALGEEVSGDRRDDDQLGGRASSGFVHDHHRDHDRSGGTVVWSASDSGGTAMPSNTDLGKNG